jgi:hypothetical protein
MTSVPYTAGPGPTPPPGYGYPPPVPPPRRTGRIVLWIVLGFLALCGIGVIGAIATAGNAPRDEQLAAQDDTNRAAAGTSSAPAAKPSNAKSTPAQVVVPAGTYTVGEDIPPGRYKTAERAGDLCYWQVSGSGGDLLDNGFGGGFPSFTVKRGQQVETHGCPDFVLQAK